MNLEKLEWLRDSVAQIVTNLRESPWTYTNEAEERGLTMTSMNLEVEIVETEHLMQALLEHDLQLNPPEGNNQSFTKVSNHIVSSMFGNLIAYLVDKRVNQSCFTFLESNYEALEKYGQFLSWEMIAWKSNQRDLFCNLKLSLLLVLAVFFVMGKQLTTKTQS